jgi:acetyl-CoA carboxylase/biotin carboxylase 1
MAQVNRSSGVKKATNGTVPIMNGSTSSYAAKHKLADHFIGGNKLANAPPSRVKDFVAAHDGHTVITNVRILRKRARRRGVRWEA